MWYVETLAAFSTIAAGLTVVLGAIGLVAFQAPRFLLNITGGLLGLYGKMQLNLNIMIS